MKEAINKAIENGFKWGYVSCKISLYSIGSRKGEWGEPNKRIPVYTFSGEEGFDGQGNCEIWGVFQLTLLDLIFGTDFIDKLVGDGKGLTECDGCEFCAEDCKYDNETLADYHRAHMANIKDIDKLKEYVRTLI